MKKIISLIFLLSFSVSLAAEKSYEIIYAGEHAHGNIAVGPTGRIVFSLHQMFQPEINMMELLTDGSTVPYPTEAWAKKPVNGSDIGTHAILGVVIDQEGTFWFMDNASTPPRLIAWDMNNEELKATYPMTTGAYTQGNSFINDMAINLRDQKVYLADIRGELSAGMIVLDIKTGNARTVLRGHPSMLPEDGITSMNIEGRTAGLNEGKGPGIGMNPISIDPSNKYVYYGSMHGTAIYRIPVTALNDENLSSEQLGKMVERYGDKPISDGISIDNVGNVYITDLEGYGIGITKPDGTYEQIIRDEKLFIWPDSITAGPDGYMYANINQLNRAAPLNSGKDTSKPPFHIVKFKPLAEITQGR